ncbi:MAG: collagen binding domain-containing protein, partial [Eggerthella lenta]
AATCDETSVSEAKTDDPARPWFGSGKRNAGISGAVPYDAAGYTIREVDSTVPAGFDHVDDWTISADDLVDGTTKYYSVIDKTLNSRIQIVKTDAETGNTVPLSGFKFQVLDSNGETMSFADPYDVNGTVDTFTTDGSGQVTIPQRLKSGKYSIKEISAAAPYTVNGDAVCFEVPKDYKKASPVTVIKVADEQAKGKATITKTCSHDGEALQGAEYDVVAQQDIVSPDGTVRAKAGDVVDHVKTGDDGKATTKELYLGAGSATYAFVETKAPSGHVLDETPTPFTISYKDGATAEVKAISDQSDPATRIDVTKTVKGGDTPLPGAKFQVWNADDEISIGSAAGNLAVRAEAGSEVSIRKAIASASVHAEADDGTSLVLKSPDGLETTLGPDAVDMEPGTYTLIATQDGNALEGKEV